MPSETPFVQIGDVAKHFGTSPATVRTWVRNGVIPDDTYIKVGYIYRFNLKKVEEALLTARKEPEQMEMDFNQDDDN
jgi:hypothetical protein